MLTTTLNGRAKKQTVETAMNILTRITYCAFVALISQSFLSLQLQAQEDDAAAPPRCHGGEIGYSSGADASSYVVGLRPLVAESGP